MLVREKNSVVVVFVIGKRVRICVGRGRIKGEGIIIGRGALLPVLVVFVVIIVVFVVVVVCSYLNGALAATKSSISAGGSRPIMIPIPCGGSSGGSTGRGDSGGASFGYS